MAKAIFTRILVSILLPLLVMLIPGRDVPVAEQQAAPAAEQTADFAALLNLNYCYGSAFSDEAIATGTLLSLLELAGEENGQRYVDLQQAEYFMNAFYGRTVDFAAAGLEVEGSRIWIPAMGYDIYTHTLISAEVQGDQVKVVSKVICDGHDGVVFDALCTSVFVRNESSAFGYNLLSSEILA